MRAAMAFFALACFGPTTASAQVNQSTVAFMLPHCKVGLNQNSGPNWYEPVCYGIVDGIAFMGSFLASDAKFCMPKDVTTEQAMTVVVRFLETRPEARNENFKIMALVAMKNAWPCK